MMDFEQVFEAYYADVRRFVLALCRDASLAEEVTQEAFFQAIQHIGRFRGQCTMLVWLCQIAKHTYYAHQKRSARFAAIVPEAASEEDVAASLVEREQAAHVHRALHTLEEPYKEVFSLRVFGELPFVQIAQLFGKTESWARVTFYRAKQKLRDRLKEEEA